MYINVGFILGVCFFIFLISLFVAMVSYIIFLLRKLWAIQAGYSDLRAELIELKSHMQKIFEMKFFSNEPFLKTMLDHIRFSISTLEEFLSDFSGIGIGNNNEEEDTDIGEAELPEENSQEN